MGRGGKVRIEARKEERWSAIRLQLMLGRKGRHGLKLDVLQQHINPKELTMDRSGTHGLKLELHICRRYDDDLTMG
jgi:hypothetical protein